MCPEAAATWANPSAELLSSQRTICDGERGKTERDTMAWMVVCTQRGAGGHLDPDPRRARDLQGGAGHPGGQTSIRTGASTSPGRAGRVFLLHPCIQPPVSKPANPAPNGWDFEGSPRHRKRCPRDQTCPAATGRQQAAPSQGPPPANLPWPLTSGPAMHRR